MRFLGPYTNIGGYPGSRPTERKLLGKMLNLGLKGFKHRDTEGNIYKLTNLNGMPRIKTIPSLRLPEFCLPPFLLTSGVVGDDADYADIIYFHDLDGVLWLYDMSNSDSPRVASFVDNEWTTTTTLTGGIVGNSSTPCITTRHTANSQYDFLVQHSIDNSNLLRVWRKPIGSSVWTNLSAVITWVEMEAVMSGTTVVNFNTCIGIGSFSNDNLYILGYYFAGPGTVVPGTYYLLSTDNGNSWSVNHLNLTDWSSSLDDLYFSFFVHNDKIYGMYNTNTPELRLFTFDGSTLTQGIDPGLTYPASIPDVSDFQGNLEYDATTGTSYILGLNEADSYGTPYVWWSTDLWATANGPTALVPVGITPDTGDNFGWYAPPATSMQQGNFNGEYYTVVGSFTEGKDSGIYVWKLTDTGPIAVLEYDVYGAAQFNHTIKTVSSNPNKTTLLFHTRTSDSWEDFPVSGYYGFIPYCNLS